MSERIIGFDMSDLNRIQTAIGHSVAIYREDLCNNHNVLEANDCKALCEEIEALDKIKRLIDREITERLVSDEVGQQKLTPI